MYPNLRHRELLKAAKLTRFTHLLRKNRTNSINGVIINMVYGIACQGSLTTNNARRICLSLVEPLSFSISTVPPSRRPSATANEEVHHQSYILRFRKLTKKVSKPHLECQQHQAKSRNTYIWWTSSRLCSKKKMEKFPEITLCHGRFCNPNQVVLWMHKARKKNVKR